MLYYNRVTVWFNLSHATMLYYNSILCSSGWFEVLALGHRPCLPMSLPASLPRRCLKRLGWQRCSWLASMRVQMASSQLSLNSIHKSPNVELLKRINLGWDTGYQNAHLQPPWSFHPQLLGGGPGPPEPQPLSEVWIFEPKIATCWLVL